MPDSSARLDATHPLKVVFAGTPDFAAESLAALLDSPHQVVAVYSQPDRPAGRGRRLTASPVKQLAQAHGLEVHQPASLASQEARDTLASLNADVLVVVAYGLLLPAQILAVPPLGCLNVHASLLPRWRGAAPIQRAIEAGDPESGVAIMQMEAGLDTGPVLREVRTPIDATTTGGILHDRLAALGAEALIATLDDLAAGKAQALAQPEEGVTYAAKLSKAEAELDFHQPAATLAARIRAFNPWPMAWCWHGEQRLRVLMAQAIDQGSGNAERGQADAAGPDSTGPDADIRQPGKVLHASADQDGILVCCGPDGHDRLCLQRVQLPGGKPRPAIDLLTARRDGLPPGTRLGQPLNGDA